MENMNNCYSGDARARSGLETTLDGFYVDLNKHPKLVGVY